MPAARPPEIRYARADGLHLAHWEVGEGSRVLYGAYAAPTKSDELWWAPGPETYELMAQFVEEHWGLGDLLAGLAPSRADDAAFRGWLAKLERLAASPRSAAALVRLMGATDVSAILPQISVPTLVLHRADDPYVDVRHAHHLAERIPNAQLTIVPGSDHFFTAGDLDSLTTPVLAFVTGETPEIDADRFLTTVLITDIVDSTRTAARLGDDRWKRLLADHFDACREQVALHRGEFVKTTGDGMLAIFDGPARAVRCGLAIRAASHDAGISLRAGVHTGECERLSDDLAGVAVHIAARTCAIADGEELFATSTVRDLAVGSMLRFDPRGTRELKGVPGAWSVFAVAEAI